VKREEKDERVTARKKSALNEKDNEKGIAIAYRKDS